MNPPIDDALDVIVIGAGQAGLSLGYHLRQQGRRFLLIDGAPALGHSWRTRWDSLRLFTPAQYNGLPGMGFPAPADTYPTKDQVADYLVDYAATFELPVRLDTTVTRLARLGAQFAVETTQGTLHAPQVVVAAGPFQQPIIPTPAHGLADDVVQLHSAAYRNPNQLPAGRVIVVGAGNSGLQISDELAATHEVTLAAGARSLHLPQRLLGRELFWWLTRLGVIDGDADSRLNRWMRARGNLVIGSSPKILRRRGLDVRPRLTSCTVDGVRFADGTSLSPQSVVWATGFRSDFSWIHVPGVVEEGQVMHQRGHTQADGLYFLGLPWQHSRGSALLGFVKHDAAWIAERIEDQHSSGRATES